MLIVGVDPGLRHIGLAALAHGAGGAAVEGLPAWRPHAGGARAAPPAEPVDPDGWALATMQTVPLTPPPRGLDAAPVQLPHRGNDPKGAAVLGAHAQQASLGAKRFMSELRDLHPVIAVGFERVPWQLNDPDGRGAPGEILATTGALLAAVCDANTRTGAPDGAPPRAPLFAEANQIRVKHWACGLSGAVTQAVPETAPLEALTRMVPARPSRSSDHSVDAALVALYTLAGMLAHGAGSVCSCGLPWGVAGWRLRSERMMSPSRWCAGPGRAHAKTRAPTGG